MGDYFHDVYLKRINQDGYNQQDRVKTRKEKEFDLLFLKKTEYQASIYKINDKDDCRILCSLQPNKWNENSLISNLLISNSERKFKTGDILRIYQKIKGEVSDKIWLIIFVEENLTKGYQLFKIICLDSVVSILDEYGTSKVSFPVKFVASQNAITIDQFIHSATQLGYREPMGNKIFITKNFDFLKKSDYFEYNEKSYEIAGINNTTVEGVAWVTVSERLKVAPELKSSEKLVVDEDTNFFLNGG